MSAAESAALRLDAFATSGLRLDRRLEEMLADHPSHCTERRGCGFTQATRHLAEAINRPRDPLDPADLLLIARLPAERLRQLAHQAQARGWPAGWRDLEKAPGHLLAELSEPLLVDALARLGGHLASLSGGADLPEIRLLAALMRAVLAGPDGCPDDLPPMPEKPAIGSCSQAEEFFLEIAHGKIRRGGSVRVHVGREGAPVLLEKMGLGESHSAISMVPLRLNGVSLPAGSLFALAPTGDPAVAAAGQTVCLVPPGGIAAARFLRLSTLVVAPRDRSRVFTRQFQHQLHSRFLSPASTTLADLEAFCSRALRPPP
ncbi:MAG: hypothetical protein KF823_05380 [Xanthomonadales bacterium]|nr:hypothetical protein [Xanthomonadales bacterium]